MISGIAEFAEMWGHEGASTLKILRTLTDASLARPVGPQDRTLGRIAWHTVTSVSEMMERTGLKLNGPASGAPVPASAKEIADGYDQLSKSLTEEMKKHWTDATLQVEDNMYGQQWKRALTLAVLVAHQTHHRGQMTVLMRQAGLKVPGVYGPAREEWAAMGAPVPEI